MRSEEGVKVGGTDGGGGARSQPGPLLPLFSGHLPSPPHLSQLIFLPWWVTCGGRGRNRVKGWALGVLAKHQQHAAGHVAKVSAEPHSLATLPHPAMPRSPLTSSP